VTDHNEVATRDHHALQDAEADRPRDAERTPQQTHSLERTSPKGGPFLGRCVLCGAADLPSKAALWACPNPRGASSNRALLDAIEGGP